MTLKNFFERLIRGWIPEEPKTPKNMLQKSSMPMASYLKVTTSLKIVYVLTLGFVAALFLGYLISYYWQDWTGSVFSVFLYSLPILFFINAIPLAIFAGVFLTKGNGLNYFRSWNAGKKLQFSGLAIVAGYISVMLLHILRVRLFIIQFDHNFPISTQVNPIYSFVVYFGLSLMAVGFTSLLILYKTSAATGEVTEANDVQKRKTTKKTWLLVFVIAVLAVSLVCLAGAHYNLQRKYDHLSEGFEFFKQDNIRLVNEQWTDNTGNDSKYVNFKAGVLNIGYGKSYNVTVIVLVNGVGNTLLKKEEIFAGDLDVFQYQELDVNIEYSGELDYVSAGYSMN
jgi:hypothetical protein